MTSRPLSGKGFGASTHNKKSRKELNDFINKSFIDHCNELINSKQYDLAEELLSQALCQDSSNELALFLITSLWNTQSLQEKTVQLLKNIDLKKLSNSGLIFNLASALEALDDFEGAIEVYCKVLNIDPGSNATLCNLGNCYRKKSDFQAALKIYSRLIEVSPDNAFYHYNLSLICMELKDYETAQKSLERSIKLKPDYISAHVNLAALLRELGHLEESLILTNKALELNCDDVNSRVNKALTLFALGDVNQSTKIFLQLWNEGNNSLAVLRNNAIAATLEKRFVEALSFYQIALESSSDEISLLVDLGTLHLILGEYDVGLSLYERRHLTDRIEIMPHYLPSLPRWNSSSVIGLKRLLLISEQGLGDTFQFIRYAQLLRNQGIYCEVAVQDPLVGILQKSCLADQVHAVGSFDGQSSCDYWLPLMSLPHLLEINNQDVKINSAYIHPSAKLVARWRENFKASSKKHIALHWKGNLQAEKTFLKGRSFTFNVFSRLLELDQSIEFLSLQKGSGVEDMHEYLAKSPNASKYISPYQDNIDKIMDFDEIAAILLNTDLLITNDTAIAHLGGALGHPTWLLLKTLPDWRWGLEGTSTIWYPNMRLFRQKNSGDWGSVIDIILLEIKKMWLC